MKCLTAEATDVSTMSLPVRGAWVEIMCAIITPR